MEIHTWEEVEYMGGKTYLGGDIRVEIPDRRYIIIVIIMAICIAPLSAM